MTRRAVSGAGWPVTCSIAVFSFSIAFSNSSVPAPAGAGTDEFEKAMEKLKTAIEQVTGQPAPLTARRVKTPEMRISAAARGVGRLVHGRV